MDKYTNFAELRQAEVVGKNFKVRIVKSPGATAVIIAPHGGADNSMRNAIAAALDDAGFEVKEHERPDLQGRSPENICNRGIRSVGVQPELARGLRATFFESLSSAGGISKTPVFTNFVRAIREGIRNVGAL